MKKFPENTKENIEKLARETLADWSSKCRFQWNKRTSAFGVFNGTDKIIYLSELLIDRPVADIKRTLLHELAHEFVREEFGTKVKSHGKEFKRIFAELCDKEGIPCVKSEDYTESDDSRYKYHIVLQDEENIALISYVRKPSNKRFRTISTSWLPDRKEETQGRLKIIPHATHLQFIAAHKAVEEAYNIVMAKKELA